MNSSLTISGTGVPVDAGDVYKGHRQGSDASVIRGAIVFVVVALLAFTGLFAWFTDIRQDDASHDYIAQIIDVKREKTSNGVLWTQTVDVTDGEEVNGPVLATLERTFDTKPAYDGSYEMWAYGEASNWTFENPDSATARTVHFLLALFVAVLCGFVALKLTPHKEDN